MNRAEYGLPSLLMFHDIHWVTTLEEGLALTTLNPYIFVIPRAIPRQEKERITVLVRRDLTGHCKTFTLRRP